MTEHGHPKGGSCLVCLMVARGVPEGRVDSLAAIYNTASGDIQFRLARINALKTEHLPFVKPEHLEDALVGIDRAIWSLVCALAGMGETIRVMLAELDRTDSERTRH